MKNLSSCLAFIFLVSTSFSSALGAQTGRCCQLDPGPTICGTCTQSECGGSGGCSNCNATSVFQGQPGFEACTPRIPLCTWELWEKVCLKWSTPGAKKPEPESRVPGHGADVGKFCLQWGNKFIRKTQIPCDKQMLSNNPDQVWIKK